MALTREFKKTVVARARNDARFRDAMFAEAINACLGGDTQTGEAMLRDLVKKMQELETFRVEHAPAPDVPFSAPLPLNSVVSVVLGAGESVEWTWTIGANGARYVSGYTIVRPRRTTRSRSAKRR